MTVDEIMRKAALRHRCFRCDAQPGEACTEDSFDHGVYTVWPHDSRLIEGCKEIIEDLRRRL